MSASNALLSGQGPKYQSVIDGLDEVKVQHSRQTISLVTGALCAVAGVALTVSSFTSNVNASSFAPISNVRPQVAKVAAGVAAASMVGAGAPTVPALALDAPPAVEIRAPTVAAPSLDAPAVDNYQYPEGDKWSYTAFKKALRADKIARVRISRADGKMALETFSGRYATTTMVRDPAVYDEMEQKGVQVTVVTEEAPSIWSVLSVLAGPLITLLGLGLLFRANNNQGMAGGNPFQLGKTTARFEMEPDTGVGFEDVAGVDEAKTDLVEVVEFLKNPERFTAVGAKIPRGLLLVGPPGTGKTLLAKAVAGEANVPFFSISGSEFVEMFVGVGASRVRDLFKKAKENSPCLIFVDEIDAVGRSRGAGVGQGNDEREQTLNQLLTEMDGFEGNTGVIVLAATNRADILDPALLRPGRFDRQVSVDVPDLKGRKQILGVHVKNKKLESDVGLDVIALRTPGFSGADLANLMNESAILAGRRNKTAISNSEIDDAIDRIVAGMEGTPMTDGKAKTLVAYHEVGHAICGTLTEGHDAVQKVTLIPRGQAKGLTWFIPGDDPSLLTKSQLRARIVGALGGRAAEEIIFGRAEITTGAGGDLQQVAGMAKQMVINFGFSDIGPWSLASPGAQSQDMIMRMMAQNEVSEQLQEDIDRNIKKIVDECYEEAKKHIIDNREAIDEITDVLTEKEAIDGDEFREILSRYTTIPAKNLAAVQAMKDGIAKAQEKTIAGVASTSLEMQ
jgi:cell division protease FtsH